MKKKAKATKGKAELPYLMYSLICESILDESNVASFIRVIDIITIKTSAPTFQPAPVEFNIALGFKATNFNGKSPFSVEILPPDRSRKELMHGELTFTKAKGGANAFIQCKLVPKEPGSYRFVVRLDGKAVGRIPLEIGYQQSTDSAETKPVGKTSK